MRHLVLITMIATIQFSCTAPTVSENSSLHDLKFTHLATTWDEGIPLGNGLLGELVWLKNGHLRFSLDRSDLWDLRPLKSIQDTSLTYQWVCDMWKTNQYKKVQQKLDIPYDQRPAPTKIPAAALEFNISELGPVSSVRLLVNNGICEIKWKNGARLLTFVQANKPAGWYRFEGIKEIAPVKLIPPAYNLKDDSGTENPVSGQDLRRLGYPGGKVIRSNQSITYNQEGWGGFHYQVNVKWEQHKNVVTGCWSVSSHYPEQQESESAENVEKIFSTGFEKALQEHQSWWGNYWAASSVSLPDTVLEKQYYLEMYKFGSAARRNTPPISLQAVWTADNGRLPPWKGDFHHDLNTQLSYWPAYMGNHLDEEEGFLNWLWERKPVFEKYTHTYFGTHGLNMPGVTTLTGEPMGGWIQYSLGPTVAAWIGQHFYLHWKYSMDSTFLKERAYPWIRSVAVYLEEISTKDVNGKRKLPLSSSPEIHDNSRNAWFQETTNFDLALIRFTYLKAAELAGELGLAKDVEKWNTILSEWPGYAISDTIGLLIAPGEPLQASHRHFSHLMAFHPLGLIDWSNGTGDRQVITNSLNYLDSLGTDWWCGYSFSWLGNMKARAMDGEGAARALGTFATCFCLPNSFHVNGDQSGTGKSKFTYRPFTLEGNFAFASGIQEMLLQSHTGIVKIFPAIPKSWKNVSFRTLRTEGAFLISAKKEDGKVTEVRIFPEKGGTLYLANPFSDKHITIRGIKLSRENLNASVIKLATQKGKEIILN